MAASSVSVPMDRCPICGRFNHLTETTEVGGKVLLVCGYCAQDLKEIRAALRTMQALNG